ncbi:hypothetical protein ES677_03550 [Bizionia gelidisalsuginis]|uniref:Uncharacterized protein n=2 Tax=Bizionia TaxID=283785 RepID=A0A8H2QLM6_9FLAO|nr:MULTISPECIES: hypothetical protein [Bizionia]TYB74463.1 hypothetical protein ES676_07240 [Bizionia saleffrena]TYC16258.1 hypothetical protein ES677_03550 [Bizionia gelidisalsuginis]
MNMLHNIAQGLEHSEQIVLKNLFNSESSNLTAVSLKREVILPKRIASTKTKILVVKGEIDFNMEGQSFRLAMFDTYNVPLEQAYCIQAYNDAVFLVLAEH